MGYPMTFNRFIGRNRDRFHEGTLSDLARLQTDSLDPLHLQGYAEQAGITPEQAKQVLEAFFAGDLPIGSQLREDGYYGLLFKGHEVVATHRVSMPPGTFLAKVENTETHVCEK